MGNPGRSKSMAPPHWVTALLAIAATIVLLVSGTIAGTDLLPASSAAPCPDGVSQTCGAQPTQDPGPTQGNQGPTTAPNAPQTTIPPNTDTGAPSAPTNGNGTFQGTVQSAPTADNPDGCIVNCGPTQTQAPAPTQQAPTTAQAPPTNGGQQPPQVDQQEAKQETVCEQAFRELGLDTSLVPLPFTSVAGGGPGGLYVQAPLVPANCPCAQSNVAQKVTYASKPQGIGFNYSMSCQSGLEKFGNCVSNCSFHCTDYLSRSGTKALAKKINFEIAKNYAIGGGTACVSIGAVLSWLATPFVGVPAGGACAGWQAMLGGSLLDAVTNAAAENKCVADTYTYPGVDDNWHVDNSGYCKD